jgi:hypothetical protein
LSSSGTYEVALFIGTDNEPPPGGVREPRRPKPQKLSPGAALEAPEPTEGLCVTAYPENVAIV